MNDQFYITLPSNSSMDYYPQNTVANFITQLSRPIKLDGAWEVAIVEVHYPCSLLTLGENSVIFIHAYPQYQYEQVRTHAWEKEEEPNFDTLVPVLAAVTLTPGDYADMKEVIDMINRHEVISEYTYFDYDEQTKRVEISNKPNVIQIEFSNQLALQLGFNPSDNDIARNNQSIRPANLKVGMPSQMYIYCDIVEPQFVGDYMAPLLRIINIDTKEYEYGGSKSLQFNSPHYVSVLKTNFESVEIDLRDITGTKIPFKFGTSCVKLHFRKRTT